MALSALHKCGLLMLMSPSSVIWFWPSAGKVTAGLAKRNGSLPPVDSLKSPAG